MNPREIRRRRIAEGRGQITRIDESHYVVSSQSRNRQHRVISTEFGWSCSCEDHQFRKVCCKHIHAVEVSIQIHQKVRDDEVTLGSCRRCDSSRTVRMGIRHNRQHDIQMYRCKDCKRKFSRNLGFERMMATPDQITMAMNLYFNGESIRKTAQSLLLTGIMVSNVTVHNWIKNMSS